jgi:GNAT superfamily N-acetyltransferase
VAGDVHLRPLRPDEAPAAAALAREALLRFVPEAFQAGAQHDPHGRGPARVAHLVEHDGPGCWAAEDDEGLCGVALALRREDLWGLSLFAVAERRRGQGVGRRLLDRALAYGEDARGGGIILSSPDPAATRSYSRAGFALRPCVSLAGPLNATRIPDGLRSRPGDPEADAATLDRASRGVRGASHGPDVAASVGVGFGLLVLEDRGFALHDEGSPMLLAAVDEAAATDLLWSCFAQAAPGATLGVDFLTAGQDWAVRAGLEAGLTVSPEGPVFTRGPLGPMTPYLPSGAWL